MPVLRIPDDLRRQIDLLDQIIEDADRKVAPKRPDMVKKQERVKKILDEPAVQEKMKKKVAKKRDRKCIDAIAKAGGDDSHPDVVKFVAKKPKGGEKEVSFVAKPKSVSDKSAKPKSLRGGHARKPNKNAPTLAGSS